MDEGDARTPATGASGLVDEFGSLRTQVVESDVDRRNGEGDVVQTLALALEESADRGVGAERLQQLDEGASHRDHRLLDTLRLHYLPVQRLHPVATAIVVEGCIEVVHGNGDVVEVDQLHQQEAKGPICPRGLTAATGSICIQ